MMRHVYGVMVVLLVAGFLMAPLSAHAQNKEGSAFTPPPIPRGAFTEAEVEALTKAITVDRDGTLNLLDESREVADELNLTLDQLKQINTTIGLVNASRQVNQVKVNNQLFAQNGLGDMSRPLYVVGKASYWWCVGKILRCEAYTAGCLASAPACAIGCAGVCKGTFGAGCASCVVACAGGAIALGETALTCWDEARKWSCVP